MLDCLPKGRLRETVAAPVVPCGCCVVGLAPAHTAAVWLSVWAARITGRPFTPAPTAVCSPCPSMLVQLSELSAPSFLFLSFTSSAYPLCSPYVRFISATLYLFVSLYLVCVFVFSHLLPSLFAFPLTQRNKRKQQQLGAVTVLLGTR